MTAGERLEAGGWRAGLAGRARQGWIRVRSAAVPVALAAITAAIAYAIAHNVLGQPAPFFAPASAWVCLGFSPDRQARRVGELAIGVSLGVALGEVLGNVLGVGAWQIGLALFVAALLARFLDRGALLTTQAGLQAVIIVALPALATGGSFGRWIDALIGGAVALVIAVVVPGRPWRRARVLAQEGLFEIAGMLSILANALRRGDVNRAAEALMSGRASQPVLDAWLSAVTSAQEAARVSPVARQHADDVAEMARACTLADHAMRNARVVTRRSLSSIEDLRELPELGDIVGRLAMAIRVLGSALGARADLAPSRTELRALAAELRPRRFDAEGWRAVSMVVLLRSLVVDLLQISGSTYDEAKAELTRE